MSNSILLNSPNLVPALSTSRDMWESIVKCQLLKHPLHSLGSTMWAYSNITPIISSNERDTNSFSPLPLWDTESWLYHRFSADKQITLSICCFQTVSLTLEANWEVWDRHNSHNWAFLASHHGLEESKSLFFVRLLKIYFFFQVFWRNILLHRE